MIAVSAPLIGRPEEELVLEVLRSGQLTQGPMVERFEQAVQEVVDAPHVVAVNNGTSALVAALLAHGIGPGDEVVTSPFTFVATLNAILLVGATPRFVDVGDDFLMDVDRLADALAPRTRAVLPVHLYGLSVDMVALRDVLGDRDVAIVADAAQALGASQCGRPVGADGTACFSFYATKNTTTGEGGVVTTDDDDVAATLRQLRNQGQRGRYDYARVGMNLRMTDLQGALGVAQMQRLPEIVAARRRNAARLSAGLSGIEGVVLPSEPPDRCHVHHQYTVRVTASAAITREALIEHLGARGVQAAVYYPRPVFDYPCFRAEPRVGAPSAPVAERVSREVLSLPVHPLLSDDDVERVVASVREVTT
jgi:perosamine synthetase